MNLNTEKNIELCRKALFSKQLQYYSKLCELYANLANIQKGVRSPEDIQARYSTALSKAARGDLSFTYPEKNYIFAEDFKGKKFSDTEIEIFKSYAFATSKLREFQEGSNILSDAIYLDDRGKSRIDENVTAEFHEFMQGKSKSTRSFDKFITEHSSKGVGHHFYLASKQAVNKINSIDSQHIPISTFIRNLNPLAFGSTLSRVNTHKRIIDEAENLYSPDEKNEYKKKTNMSKEFAYKIGQKTGKVYKANKAKVRQVMVGAACIALLLGGAARVNEANEFKTLDVKTNTAQGYKNYVSQDTIAKLSAIRQSIESAETSATTPTFEELSEIRNNLDNVIDDVMTDLVTEAFESQNPDCKVTSVDTLYDKTTNQYATAGTQSINPENFCTISYNNEKGEEKSITITEFSSFAPLFTGNSISDSFENEYILDKTHPYIDSSKTFLEKDQDVLSILSQYKEILESTEHLAGTQMIYSGGFLFVDPSLKTVLPEKLQTVESKNVQTSDTKLASQKEIIEDDWEK